MHRKPQARKIKLVIFERALCLLNVSAERREKMRNKKPEFCAVFN